MTLREGGAEHARVVATLQALVRIPTVSHRDPARVDTGAFDDALAELERSSRCCTPSSS